MEMMKCGDAKTPLHLKLVIYHEERERQGRAMDIHLSDVNLDCAHCSCPDNMFIEGTGSERKLQPLKNCAQR
jgi:hypothetical protein